MVRKSTSAPATTSSEQTGSQKSVQRSVQVARRASSIHEESPLSGLDMEKANVCLLTLLFKMAQEYPSSDAWFLAANSAKHELLGRVVNEEEWETLMRGLGKLSEAAIKTSIWPEGFF
jgi:hypothetical protein